MILGQDTTPERQLYYLGALVLESLNKSSELDFFDVASKLKRSKGISMNIFILSLDWLFILGAIKMKGDKIIKCT